MEMVGETVPDGAVSPVDLSLLHLLGCIRLKITNRDTELYARQRNHAVGAELIRHRCVLSKSWNKSVSMFPNC